MTCKHNDILDILYTKRNKQTNFKLNHDVANQMWGEAKLGHLLPLGPFRMLEAWCA